MDEGCIYLKYYGHSAIGVEADEQRIIIDPHDGSSLGLKPIPDKADVVLITHEHFDHNAKEAVAKPDSLVISSFIGEKDVRHGAIEFELKGYRLPHDRFNGSRRGYVSAYLLEMRNIRLLHMGDVGAPPEEDFYTWLGKERIDFLFLPVGGTYTVEPPEAWEIASRINPVYTVPIHYWRRGVTLPIAPLSDFLKFTKTGKIEVEQPFKYCGEKREEKTKILVFKGMY